MPETGTLTIRLPKRQLERLKALATSTRRSRSFLAAEAVAEYLAAQEWQIAAVNEGIAAADRGELIPHERVAEWLDSWGTDRELPPPAR